MYWDKHGIEGISLRIGTTMGRPPENERHLSTWMGTEDLVQLVMSSIEARDVGYAAVWGVSANTRAYYDLSRRQCHRLPAGAERRGMGRRGPQATQSARPHRPQKFQGGQFVTTDYTPRDRRS